MGLVGPCLGMGIAMTFSISLVRPASGSVLNDADLKNALLISYGSTSTRPSLSAAAAAQSGSCASAPPEQIRVQAYVEKFRGIDTKTQLWGFEGYLRAWWTDPRLAFNGTLDGGCFDKLSLGSSERTKIWKPAFYWEGASAITTPTPSNSFGELLEVYPDGSIWWSRQTSFTLKCPFDISLDNAPFDTHSCSFMLGMYADTSFDSNLQWKEGRKALANSDGACLKEWYVTDHKQENVVLDYSSANYTYARADLLFSRAFQPTILSYLLPAVVLVISSYFGFFIDPLATPARVSLSMLTIVVTSGGFLSLINSLPNTLRLPWIVAFVQGCLYFNIAAMVEVVLVSFGTLSQKWLTAQQNVLNKQMNWQEVLVANRDILVRLFKEWDGDGSGTISRKEFRRGVASLRLVAQKTDINALFNDFDHNGDGTLNVSELEEFLGQQANFGSSGSPGSPGRRRSVAIKDTPVEVMSMEEAVANDLVPEPDEESSAQAVPSQQSCPGSAAQVKTPGAPQRMSWHPVKVSPAKSPQVNQSHGMTALKRAGSTKGSKARQLQQEMSGQVRQGYINQAREDLDLGWLWKFKVWYLFPMLTKLQYLDHYARWAFPTAFMIFILVMFSRIDYNGHVELLRSSPCYQQ